MLRFQCYTYAIHPIMPHAACVVHQPIHLATVVTVTQLSHRMGANSGLHYAHLIRRKVLVKCCHVLEPMLRPGQCLLPLIQHWTESVSGQLSVEVDGVWGIA